MSKKTRKILAIIGVICMVSSVFPFMAILAEEPIPISVDEGEGDGVSDETGDASTPEDAPQAIDGSSGSSGVSINVYHSNGQAIVIKDVGGETAIFVDLNRDGAVGDGEERISVTYINPDTGLEETRVDFKGFTFYGGGTELNTTYSSTMITMESGNVWAIYGGSNGATYNGDVKIDVKGGVISNNIFGGGRNADVAGYNAKNIDVNISNATVQYAHGGSENGNIGNNAAGVDVSMTISNSTINGNVVGGSLGGVLTGSVSLNLQDNNTVPGDVFAGSSGGDVLGRSHVEINNTNINGTLYGAGNKSDVSTVRISGLSTIGSSGSGGIIINSDLVAEPTPDQYFGFNSVDVGTSVSTSSTINLVIPDDARLGSPVITGADADDHSQFSIRRAAGASIIPVLGTPVRGSNGEYSVNLMKQLQKPNIGIDFYKQLLTNFDATVNYEVFPEGSNPAAFSEITELSIAETYFGKKLAITALGDNVATIGSAAQNITVPPIPAAPGATSTIGGQLSGVNNTMEYSYTSDFKLVIPIESATIENLVGGDTVYVRIAATDSSFASTGTEVLIEEFDAEDEDGQTSIIVTNAKKAVDNTNFEVLKQDASTTEQTVISYVDNIVKTAVNNAVGSSDYSLFTITPKTQTYVAAEAGYKASDGTIYPGKDGSYTFTYDLEITKSYPQESYIDPDTGHVVYPDPLVITKNAVTVTKVLVIDALEYDGADVDSVIEAIEAASSDFVFLQKDVSSLESAEVELAKKIDKYISGDVKIDSITITNFTVAIEGNSANKPGTEGSFNFVVKLSSTEEGASYSNETISMGAKITATIYEGLRALESVDLAISLISPHVFSFPQATANDEDESIEEVATLINDIDGMEDTGIQIIPGAISIINEFRPAEAGTPDNENGVDGGFTFNVVVAAPRGSVIKTVANSATIVATSYKEHSAREAIKMAEGLIESAAYTYTQEEVRTEDNAKAKSVEQVNTLIATTGLVVNENDIEGTNFVAAIEGYEGKPDGINGEYDFRVHLEKNGESSTTSEVSALIRAYALPGQSTEEILAKAKTAAEGATYDDTTQASTPDEGAAKVYIRDIAEEAIDNTGVGVEVNSIAYTAPIAGTQDAPDGTDGALSFTITLERNDITESTGEKTIKITATKYGEDSPEEPGVKPPVTEGGKTEVGVVVDPDTSGSESEVVVKPEEFEQAVDSAIEEAEKQGTTPVVRVTVNTPPGATSAKVILPVPQLEKLSAVAGSTLIVESGLGIMEFDHAALVEMTNQAKASGATQVEIFIGKVDKSTLTADQQTAVGDDQAYEIHVMANGSYITNFGSGQVKVTLNNPGDMSNANSVTVFYAPPEGSPEALSTSHSATSGIVTFVTNHFSIFYAQILDEGEEPSATPSPTTSGSSGSGSSGSGSGGTTGDDDDPTTNPTPETGDKSTYIMLCIGLFTSGMIMLIMAGARKITRNDSDYAV